MHRRPDCSREVANTVDAIHAIGAANGVSPASLAKIRDRLTALATGTDLVTVEDFPPPAPGQACKSGLYRRFWGGSQGTRSRPFAYDPLR